MRHDVRQMLQDLTEGLGKLSTTQGPAMASFMGLLNDTITPNALTTKEKEIISLGIAIYTRCEYCIVFHVYNALQAGATRAELEESAMIGVTFGGGPSITSTAVLLNTAITEFEKDFN